MGEAGIGKSSLVEALRARLPGSGRMLIGYCDDLATPRTLGPFRDLVGSVRAELSQAVMDGSDRDRVLAALHAELSWPEHPTVLVIEDIHWADDATLDALRFLIRRIADLPAVLILTYRDDELDREHPLRGLLGQASRSDHVRHLPLGRLSPAAVRQLSAGSSVDADDLFALTSGNPFFVQELLDSALGERVPRTIVDAVLARLRQLDPPVQDALEQLAVVPSALERWLVDALVPDSAPGRVAVLAAAEQRGLLTVSARGVSFRHELTRRAIAGSLPLARLVALNQRALAALVARDGSDVAQIVHHAAQAGDAEAIVRYGPGRRPGRGPGRRAPRGGRAFRPRPGACRPVPRGRAGRTARAVRGRVLHDRRRGAGRRGAAASGRTEPAAALTRASSAPACGGWRGCSGGRAIARKRCRPSARRFRCSSGPGTSASLRWP